MTFTAREKKLLYLLLLALIAAAGMFAMSKLTAGSASREQELAELQSSSAQMRGALSSLEELRDSIPQLEAQTAEIKSRFRIYGGATAMDNIVTDTALAAGLTPYALELSEPYNSAIPYYGEEVGAQAQGGMCWYCPAAFTAQGTERQLHAFLDAAAADDSLHVRSFSFTGERTGTLTVTFELDLYTYEPIG